MVAKKVQEKPQREKLYTIDEMASLLQVEKRQLVEWVQYRRIPFVKVDGHLVRFRVSDIVQWVKKNKMRAESPKSLSLR